MSATEQRTARPLRARPAPVDRPPAGPRRALAVRAVASLTLAGAIIAVGLAVLSGGEPYTLHLEFLNAGRVVEGGEVQIAGVKVGSISGIGLTPNGLADVTISIGDSADVPLHRGTRAAIREVGAATIANNFVALSPGPSNQPALTSGATLAPTQTTGIVDLDAVLDAFTPSVRSSMQGLIANAAHVFAGSGSRYFNGMLLQLDPALAQLDGLSQQLGSDQANLGGLVSTATRAATAIASRASDLRSAVGHTAMALGAIAGEQNVLADALTRAPSVLQQGRGTLVDLTTALTALRPTLREVPPAAGPLGEFLGLLRPTLRRATPVLAQLRAQLPGLRSSLAGFSTLERPADSGLHATATGLQAANPILRGMRFYGSDFIVGILNGFVSIFSGNYDKAGHYGHASFSQSPLLLPGGALGSAIPNLSGISGLSPALFNIRTHLLSRCPGGASPPAPDGSSPWIPDKSLCNPADDIPISVDQP